MRQCLGKDFFEKCALIGILFTITNGFFSYKFLMKTKHCFQASCMIEKGL